MSENRIPDVFIRSLMSLYEGANTRVKVDSELSEDFEVEVEMHQGSVLSCFLFAVVVYVVTEFAKKGALCELLYTDDLVLTSETIKKHRDKFFEWQEAFESKCFKVDLWKTKVMVCGGITKDGLSKSKIDPCGVCSLRVKANSVLYVQCCKWIHGRFAGV